VFCVKYRRKALTTPILDRLEDGSARMLAALDCELVELTGDRDHVHVLIRHPARVSIPEIAQRLKGRSAFVLRRQFPELGHRARRTVRRRRIRAGDPQPGRPRPDPGRLPLVSGGCLLNLDLVFPTTPGLADLYRRDPIRSSAFDVHIDPAGLEEQLRWLRVTGFAEVRCVWKDLDQGLLWGLRSR